MKPDFFKLRERGTSIRTECLAGATTFMTMSYILAVNPLILSQAGMPAGSVFTATVLSSILAMLVMGLLANLPIALAPAMGLNAFFAYTVCMKMGYPYPLALTAVFCEGLVFLLMSVFNIRETIVNAIPLFLKKAVTAGIGLFIAFIGLQSAEIVTASPGTLVSAGNLASAKPALALFGLALMVVLFIRRVKSAFLIGIFTLTLLGIPLGLTQIPEDFSVFSRPEKPLFFDFMPERVLSFDFFIVFFTFFFIDLFDTIGTFVGIASQGGLMKADGTVKNLKQGLLADALGTTAGAVLGTSTVSSYIESASGVAAGGRTGLTSLTVAALFAAALFLSPLFLLIPAVATAPVLIMVGFLMMAPVREIDFSDYAVGLPAFMTMLMMPMAYSIAEGIVFGILCHVLCQSASGRARCVPPAAWILSVVFLAWLFLR